MRIFVALVILTILGAVPPAPGAWQAVERCPLDAGDIADRTMLICSCESDDTRGGGIWGTDIYTDDSRICRAGVHAGAITSHGGIVKLEIVEGRNRYLGSERRGIASQPYRQWPRSYRFLRLSDRLAIDRCPDTARNLPIGRELRCLCLQMDVEDGPVWGTGVYADGSRVCRAALHAGLIGERGGVVLIRREPGRDSYRGSTRFGVVSSGYGRWDGSFVILAGEGNF